MIVFQGLDLIPKSLRGSANASGFLSDAQLLFLSRWLIWPISLAAVECLPRHPHSRPVWSSSLAVSGYFSKVPFAARRSETLAAYPAVLSLCLVISASPSSFSPLSLITLPRRGQFDRSNLAIQSGPNPLGVGKPAGLSACCNESRTGLVGG